MCVWIIFKVLKEKKKLQKEKRFDQGVIQVRCLAPCLGKMRGHRLSLSLT